LIDGVLLLDKPLGLSSTAAGSRVRRLLGASKAGHVGSLDPLATGMLPICLGEATKLAGEILEGNKVYRFRIALGERRSTGDAEGDVVETAVVPSLDATIVESALAGFVGDSLQVPPMYSAIKQGGVPLYKRARAGETVERAARPIRIERLELLQLGAASIECRVVCGKGTYVRVLAEDIARALSTVGYVSALRRESVQPFGPERLVTLEAIESGEAAALPLVSLDEAVGHLRLVSLGETATRRLAQGQVVDATEALRFNLGETVRVHGPEGRFLGLGRVAAPARIAAKRLVAQQVSEYNPRPSTRP
jgi:tRNA pseudouridine55 synthase